MAVVESGCSVVLQCSQVGRNSSIVAPPFRLKSVALAREELGLNPEDLGSPWGAALFSFVSFGIGSSIPLLPFFFGVAAASLPAVIALTAIALFAVGATLSLFTGRNALLSGARMLAIGVAAGGITFMVGKLLGVSLA